MLDATAYRACAWRPWHVFLYAFIVHLTGIVAIAYHGQLVEVGLNALWGSALLAAVAVAGIGYQEARELGAFRKSSQSHAADDDW